MKRLFALVLPLAFLACDQSHSDNAALEKRIDSLEQKLAGSYRPGLGEFMSDIQVHHAKLWFAGTNENWRLADFEIHEIMEAVDDIKQYETDRPEVKEIPMLTGALDSVNAAIGQKDPAAFHRSFVLLTNTCNKCHQAVNYDFNQVKIPDSPPFSNQVFKQP